MYITPLFPVFFFFGIRSHPLTRASFFLFRADLRRRLPLGDLYGRKEFPRSHDVCAGTLAQGAAAGV